MADADEVSAWLEGVREGLGKHACVFLAYGATTIDDLRDIDDDDTKQLMLQLGALEGGPAPLQVKQIVKALRSLAKASAAGGAGSSGTPQPATAPRPATQGSAGTSSAAREQEDDDEQEEDDSDSSDEEYVDEGEEEGDQTPRPHAPRKPNATMRPRARQGKARASASATSAAAGKQKVNMMNNRSTSAGGWRGIGGQASAKAAGAGRSHFFGRYILSSD